MNSHLEEFQTYIEAYPTSVVTLLKNAIERASEVSIKKDDYWVVNEDHRTEISDLFRHILAQIQYPGKADGIALIKDIPKEQIPILNILSKIDGLYLNRYALPRYASTRQRWLGLKPAEITEREISFRDFQEVPLWYALQRCETDSTTTIQELLIALNLNLDDRLALFASISIEEYGIDTDAFPFSDCPWGILSDVTADQAAWAIKWADRLIDTHWQSTEDLLWPLFVALIKGNVALKPEWEVMLPIESQNDEKFEIIKKLLSLIPESRRSQVITKKVSESLSKVASGLKLLPTYPSAELTQFILDNINKCSFLSPQEITERVSTVAEKSSLVKATLDNYMALQNTFKSSEQL